MYAVIPRVTHPVSPVRCTSAHRTRAYAVQECIARNLCAREQGIPTRYRIVGLTQHDIAAGDVVADTPSAADRLPAVVY